jgi:segregation and condensation protein A
MEIKEENKNNIEKSSEISVKQEQVHSLLFGRELGWQDIIYDLINTEQLDPWDIDIIKLTEAYLIKIEAIEEADFFVSSKVLLAAALLLRIKSEILLDKYIKSIDEILFGKKEEKKYSMERIELEDEIPELIPKSPIPRMRKVTLKELMEALNKAIVTENRRIKKEILNKNALREVGVSLPERKISIKDKIKEIYDKIINNLKEEKKKVSYSELIGSDRDEKILSFFPLLQLEHQQKIWLDQEAHFDEIYIWFKHIYLKNNPDPFEELRETIQEEISEEIEREIEEFSDEEKQRVQELNKDFENPLGEMFE